MDFEKQLKSAIDRGKSRGDAEAKAEKEKKLSETDLRSRHVEFRLGLSEHIEQGLKQLCEHFPGFDYETLIGEKGWGGRLSRDDLNRGGSFYSRVEIAVRPINEFNVVNITGKGTIKNKEVFNWNHFEDIPDGVMEEFQKKIDSWILMYAEKFASS